MTQPFNNQVMFGRREWAILADNNKPLPVSPDNKPLVDKPLIIEDRKPSEVDQEYTEDQNVIGYMGDDEDIEQAKYDVMSMINDKIGGLDNRLDRMNKEILSIVNEFRSEFVSEECTPFMIDKCSEERTYEGCLECANYWNEQGQLPENCNEPGIMNHCSYDNTYISQGSPGETVSIGKNKRDHISNLSHDVHCENLGHFDCYEIINKVENKDYQLDARNICLWNDENYLRNGFSDDEKNIWSSIPLKCRRRCNEFTQQECDNTDCKRINTPSPMCIENICENRIGKNECIADEEICGYNKSASDENIFKDWKEWFGINDSTPPTDRGAVSTKYTKSGVGSSSTYTPKDILPDCRTIEYIFNDKGDGDDPSPPRGFHCKSYMFNSKDKGGGCPGHDDSGHDIPPDEIKPSLPEKTDTSHESSSCPQVRGKLEESYVDMIPGSFPAWWMLGATVVLGIIFVLAAPIIYVRWGGSTNNRWNNTYVGAHGVQVGPRVVRELRAQLWYPLSLLVFIMCIWSLYYLETISNKIKEDWHGLFLKNYKFLNKKTKEDSSLCIENSCFIKNDGTPSLAPDSAQNEYICSSIDGCFISEENTELPPECLRFSQDDFEKQGGMKDQLHKRMEDNDCNNNYPDRIDDSSIYNDTVKKLHDYFQFPGVSPLLWWFALIVIFCIGLLLLGRSWDYGPLGVGVQGAYNAPFRHIRSISNRRKPTYMITLVIIILIVAFNVISVRFLIDQSQKQRTNFILKTAAPSCKDCPSACLDNFQTSLPNTTPWKGSFTAAAATSPSCPLLWPWSTCNLGNWTIRIVSILILASIVALLHLENNPNPAAVIGGVAFGAKRNKLEKFFIPPLVVLLIVAVIVDQ